MAILASEVKFWHELNEGSGTNTNEENGGADGTLTGGITWNTTGKVTTNSITMPSGVSLERVTTGESIPAQVAFTVFGWYHHAGGGNFAHMFGSRGTTGSHSVNIYKDTADKINARLVHLGTANDFIITTAADLADGAWHFLVFQRSAAGAAELFIDNVSRGTATNSTSVTAGVCHLGNWPVANTSSDWCWDGKLNGWGWINRALDATERSALWNSGNGTTYTAYMASVASSFIPKIIVT